MNSFRTLLAFILILIIAAFFRLHALDTTPPGLYPDEAMNGNNVLEALESPPPEGGFRVFYPENNGREGLFINIQGLFLKTLIPLAGGNPEPWMLRLPSALFGIITVAGVFFLARELFKKDSVALLSAFLLAVSFWHINFSRIGFRAIMAPFFLVWGIYLLLLTFRKLRERSYLGEKKSKYQIPNTKQIPSPDDQNNGVSKFGNWKLFENWKLGFGISILAFIAGMVYGLGMHSYIAYRATPLIIAVILFLFTFKIGWKAVGKITIWFALGAIIVSLPLAAYFIHNPQDFFGRTSEVSVFSSSSPLGGLGLNIAKTIGMLFFFGDSNWRHNLSGAPELFWPVAIVFLLGAVVGVWKLFKKPDTEHDAPNSEDTRPAFIILIVYFFTALLPVVFSNEGIPHALRSILMIPSVFIIAGFGGITLYEWLENRLQHSLWRRILPLTACLFFLFVATTTYQNYFITWGENSNTSGAFSEEYVTIGRKLNAIPENIQKYVIVEAGGVLARGIPMPSQTVMFMTDTFTKWGQEKKNIHYVLPKDAASIPQGGYVVTIK